MGKATDLLEVMDRNHMGARMSDVPNLTGELKGTGMSGGSGGAGLVAGEPNIQSGDAFGFESDPKKADDNRLYALQAILPKDEVPAKAGK